MIPLNVQQWFQSTLPWWERLVKSGPDPDLVRVSIHAPVVGATHEHIHEDKATVVSIHAPVVGATAFWVRLA